MSKRWTNLNSIGWDLELKESEHRLEHVLTRFLEFSVPFFQSHLLINYQISSSKNLPANRKRDFRPNSANGILGPLFATPSIELKKRICIVSISRHNPFGKLKPRRRSALGRFPKGLKTEQKLYCKNLEWNGIHNVWQPFLDSPLSIRKKVA